MVTIDHKSSKKLSVSHGGKITQSDKAAHYRTNGSKNVTITIYWGMK